LSPLAPWLAAHLVGGAALASALPTQAEAVALAFPGAEVSRRERFLSEAELDEVRAKAAAEVKSRYVVVYEARRAGALVGYALFDTHVVRTAPETAMVALSPQGVVLRVEVVQFREPAEYAAPARWVAQLEGRTLGPGLSLRGDVRPLSGASLTARALVDATRRALALFAVLGLGTGGGAAADGSPADAGTGAR
jgi:hypothetical protein